MKKLPAAIGIIVFLTGLFVTYIATIRYVGTYFEFEKDTPVEVSNSWNITRFYENGTWLKLEVVADQTWSEHLQPPDAAVSVPYQPVFLNITDPNGNESEVYCDFIMLNENAALVFYNITVTGNGSLAGISFDPAFYGSKPGIVAKTQISGNYTARITAIMGGGNPPFTMRLRKSAMITENFHVYSNFLYPGIVTVVVGVVLMVYGFMRTRTTATRAHRRRDLSNKKAASNGTIRQVPFF